MLTSRGLRLIQYGRSSAGKSTRAAGAARWGKVEIHDFDNKAQNLAAYISKFSPELLENITVVSYDHMTDNQRIDKFLKRVKDLQKKPDITTLVLDSLTRFEEAYLNFLMSVIPSSGTGFGSQRFTTTVGGEQFTVLGTNDYGILASGMKKLVGWLKDIPINIIVNAHLKDPVETKKEIVDEGTLASRGQIREWLPTEFTEFHRLFVDEYMKHRVQVRPSSQYLASTALADVPPTGVLQDNSLAVFDNIAFKIDNKPKTV